MRRFLAVVGVVAGLGWLGVGPAAAGVPAVSAGAADVSGGSAGGAAGSAAAAPAVPSVTLLGQTPWVETKGVFQLRVGIAGASAGDQVEVAVYDQVRTRTQFDQIADGQIDEGPFTAQAVAPSALPRDPAGGVDIDLGVEQPAPAGSPFTQVVSISEQNGVFPVQVFVVGPGGNPVGAPLTTFLVYSQGTSRQQGFTPLSAALIVPFSTEPQVTAQGQLAAVAGSESTRLAGLAAAFDGDTDAHASLLVSPATLDALSAGAKSSLVDRTALDEIGGAPDGGLEQVLPTPWSPVRLGDLEQAGLGSEVSAQLSGADRVLRSDLGDSPGRTTWVVDGPVDQTDLDQMADHGATQLIVPSSDLTAPEALNTTFAQDSLLGSASSPVMVVGADPGLSADFARRDPPVLAANVLLADLAMIFTEAPSDTRAVAAMPPAGWAVNPTFVSTVLAGLSGNPLVSADTATGLFAAAGTPVGVRYLSDPDPAPSAAADDLAADRGTITAARTDVSALDAVFPSDPTQLGSVADDLLLAESETLTPAQRAAVLAQIHTATAVVARAVTLPPSASITLTATKGQIPITILTAGALRPQVELRLRSPRLIFLGFRPPEGTCTVPTPTVEDCLLSLKTQNTTLKVPVETRSSGVFALYVDVFPPGQTSGTALAADQDTVRSTAVSSVAIVLIVLALMGLAFWWVRDIRRGRRPQGMLPSPAGPGAEAADDVLEDFFSRPPPDYGSERMSPSGAAAGPSPVRDRYRPDRETRE